MERKLTAMRLGCRRRIRLRKEGGSWLYSPYPSRREKLGLCTVTLALAVRTSLVHLARGVGTLM